MTQNFIDLMHLFACGAIGRCPDVGRKYNMEAILGKAIEQGILPVVFPAIKELYKIDATVMNAERYKQLNMMFTQCVYANIQRLNAVKETVSYLEKNNITCCMLKGITLAGLYNVPETRISGDTDILLDSPRLEKRACALLARCGFQVRKHPGKSHHALCKSDKTGLLEFHLTLYDELFEDVWFNNITENTEQYREIITPEGHTYKTLGVTDGAIFVTLHFIKHFLSGTEGLRQLMDMLLYNEHYKEQIDWSRYDAIMTYLRYDRFISCCRSIGKVYFGIDYREHEEDNRLAERVLSDMEDGGLFASRDKGRKEFYRAYTKARFSVFRNDTYDEYMSRWGHVSFLSKLFPSFNQLSYKYPFLRKYSVLYVPMLIFRIVTAGIKFLSSHKKKATKTYDERMNLIEELKMV